MIGRLRKSRARMKNRVVRGQGEMMKVKELRRRLVETKN